MTHGHVNGLFRSDYESSLEIVGIYESDTEVVKKYQLRYDLEPDLFVDDLEAFLDEKSPSAVWVFTNTFDHLKVVEACAPRGVHVIVEKPLAVDEASASANEGAFPETWDACANESGNHLVFKFA